MADINKKKKCEELYYLGYDESDIAKIISEDVDYVKKVCKEK